MEVICKWIGYASLSFLKVQHVFWFSIDNIQQQKMPPSKESTPATAANKRKEAAREVIDTLHEMAILLVGTVFRNRIIVLRYE